MCYVVQFVNRNELTGYLKCDVKNKYVLVIINLDKVNVYHDISIHDIITIRFYSKTISDNIELSPSFTLCIAYVIACVSVFEGTAVNECFVKVPHLPYTVFLQK